MFCTILQWEVLQKIILNTLLVSIPEEFFLVMFTLILVGEFEIWREPECKRLINRYDYGRILIPSLVSAFLSNVLRYLGIDYDIISIVTILSVLILMIFTNDIFGDASALKWIGRAVIFLTFACIVIALSEFLYVPLIVYGTGRAIQEINQNIYLNFLISLPSRTIQYMILIYLVYKKRTVLRGGIIKHILQSSTLLLITLMIALIDLLFCIIACNLIIYQKFLVDADIVIQTIVIIGVILFPILNIFGLLWLAYYLINRDILCKKRTNEKLGRLLKEIKIYTESEKYDNIKWKLNEIGMGIEEIASGLLYEDEIDKKLKSYKEGVKNE